MNKQDYIKVTVDVPFRNKHIRFENLTSEQANVLMQLSEFYQLSGVRRSAAIPQEKLKQEKVEEKPIHKFNSGIGATLCHKCSIIISEGHTQDLYCEKCKIEQL